MNIDLDNLITSVLLCLGTLGGGWLAIKKRDQEREMKTNLRLQHLEDENKEQMETIHKLVSNMEIVIQTCTEIKKDLEYMKK